MENQKQKCSSKKHKEVDAIIYCSECKVFLCNKCQNFHSDLWDKHKTFNLDIDIDIEGINEEFCKEKNHPMKLEYYCKTHNQLCCAACLTKLQSKGNGQHKDCDVCTLEEIIEQKEKKFNDNLNCLEELNKTLEQTIEELKKLVERINKDKEEIKLNIQKIFTKVRSALNEREDELLLEVDNQFNEFYFKEELIKKKESLPNKVKICIFNSKQINEKNKDYKFYSLIKQSTNIENYIKEINLMNEIIKKCDSNKNSINFILREKELNELLEKIKILGAIYNINDTFKFKICPNKISQNRKYIVTGEKKNILTKIGEDKKYMGAICSFGFEKGKEYKWKIKILISKGNLINIGVAPIDFDIYLSDYKYGWYLYLEDLTLWSGPPHNFEGKKTKFNKVKSNEIVVVMNMNKGTLKFIIDNEDKGESYINIPLDKALSPAVILYNKDDSVEIIEC